MSKTSGSSTLERAPIDLVALREEGRQNLVDVLQEVRDATRAGMDSLGVPGKDRAGGGGLSSISSYK